MQLQTPPPPPRRLPRRRRRGLLTLINLYALSAILAIGLTALYANALCTSAEFLPSWAVFRGRRGRDIGEVRCPSAAEEVGISKIGAWAAGWAQQQQQQQRQRQRPLDGKNRGEEEGNGWDILYHLGGNSPWIRKVDGVVEGGVGAPDGCVVEQVHMLSRHAERFPTVASGGRMLDIVRRLQELEAPLRGDLAFVNEWEYFTKDPGTHLEQLVTTGPYAGTLEAFTTGVKLRTRYTHLLPVSTTRVAPTKDKKQTPRDPDPLPTKLWASDSQRVIDTAQYFRTGFFGLDAENSTSLLEVIPETSDRGANTLTPGDTCLRYRSDLEHGHDYGAAMLAKFRATYLGAIGRRFEGQNPHLELAFDDAELYSMQEMCGFETLARGNSPWCDVFTRGEWEAFEYARDVIHYYRAGPGNPYGPAMGWLWLNATANLLSTGSSAGPFFFSFVHDGDIIPMLAALNIFPSSSIRDHDDHDDSSPRNDKDLPTTHILHNRTWRTSQVTPMGGRILFERLTCSDSTPTTTSTADSQRTKGESRDPSAFVRINVNDGIVAMPKCSSGPGHSCPLEQFLEIVRRRGEEVGDFRETCGLGSRAAERITFLHQ